MLFLCVGYVAHAVFDKGRHNVLVRYTILVIILLLSMYEKRNKRKVSVFRLLFFWYVVRCMWAFISFSNRFIEKADRKRSK